MSNVNMTSKIKKVALLGVVLFLTYNIIVFTVFGFGSHGGTFWISYVFAILAFIITAISGWLYRNSTTQMKDWLFGYPIFRHCIIYVSVELICSIIFMVADGLDCPMALAVVVQILILAVHLVFNISGFLAKETIQDVRKNIKINTAYIRNLQVDVEMLAEKTQNKAVKEAVSRLAEQVRFSDPMGNDKLLDIQMKISETVEKISDCVLNNDEEGALENCEKARLLLVERNKRCELLK